MDNNITNNNLNITATPIEGENYVHLEWNKIAPGYIYRVYSKEQDENVYQSIPSKSDIIVLNIYPDSVQNTGLSGGGKDLDGNSIPDSGILKTWLEKEKIENVKIESVSLTSFNANPSKYLNKISGKWNYDCVFYGMWNLDPSITYPNDAAIEYLRTFINDGGGFMTSHHTLGLSRLDGKGLNTTTSESLANGINKGVNKLAKEMGVEIFDGAQSTAYPMYSGAGRDSSGNLFSTVSFETSADLPTDSYWPMGDTVKLSKGGLLSNYPFNIGKIGDTFTIPMNHGLSVFGKGDVWMQTVNPTGHGSYKFNEITNSPSTGAKGTNNFYVHTYNNTAIINSGHSFPNVSQAEVRIIANTLYYLAQLTSDTSCDDHKGQDFAKPDKVNINNVSSDDKNLKVTYSKPNDNGTQYEYYVKASDGDSTNDITSNTVSVINTSGIAGYSYVVDNIENTEPDNKIITTDSSISVPLSGLDLIKPIYVHIRAIDNAGNASETTHYEYKYITSLNLDKSSLNINTGDKQNLIATTTPAGMQVTWTSSDPSVATVDSSGNVTGVKEGQATITVNTVQGNLSATCIVNVIEKPTQLVNTAYAKGDNTNTASGEIPTIFNGLAETTLSVVKTSDAKTVCVGDIFTYTIIVTNTGSKTAEKVVIKDNAPKHIQFMPSGITTTQGTVDSSSSDSNIVVNVGDIPPAGTVTITVPATVVL